MKHAVEEAFSETELQVVRVPGNLGITALSDSPACWLLFILALAQFSVE
jgi:hypothetical protein